MFIKESAVRNLARKMRELPSLVRIYEKTVSDKVHHTSVHYLHLMAYLIRKFHKGNCIYDFGSGLTTAMLWKYGHLLNCRNIFTIDDSEKWLERTQRFMNENKIHFLSDKMITCYIDTFHRLSIQPWADFISYDFSTVPARILGLNQLLPPLIKKGTMILFDDAHKPGYEAIITTFCDFNQLELIPVKHLTAKEDFTKRFAMLAIKIGF